MTSDAATNESTRPPSPATLVPLKVAAAYVRLKPEILKGWVASGHAPHYYVGKDGPLFKKSELMDWVRDNMVVAHKGMPLPTRIDVANALVGPTTVAPPPAIQSIEGLCHLRLEGQISGIYFLCDREAVVYVGQSVNVLTRVTMHMWVKKKQFDVSRVYFLPCPPEQLDELERRYIWLLKPQLNSITFKKIQLQGEKAG